MEALTGIQQLAEIREELQAATARVRQMQEALSADDWQRKPSAERWSAIECIEHLNVTNRATLAKIREGLSSLKGKPRHRDAYRHDLFGWLLVKSLSSRSRFSKSKTNTAFVPVQGLDVPTVLAEFVRLQNDLVTITEESVGVPLDAHKMQSVFEARIKYNLYSALKIVAVHTTRHLDQAERATRGE